MIYNYNISSEILSSKFSSSRMELEISESSITKQLVKRKRENNP